MGDAEDLYGCGSLDAWYWRRRLYARLSAFVVENDFRIFRRIYLEIVGLSPCLPVGQLCLCTVGADCNTETLQISATVEGSAATMSLRCGGICNDRFVANFVPSPAVKEF